MMHVQSEKKDLGEGYGIYISLKYYTGKEPVLIQSYVLAYMYQATLV